MKSIAPIMFLVVVMALGVPRYFSKGDSDSTYEQTEEKADKKSRKRKKKKGPKTARAFRGSNGHFTFNAMLNGNNVKVLVDTGATAVAINERTARRIGIKLKSSDFRHKASTANGVTSMAHATIKKIRIGGVEVRNVRAAVLRNEALGVTLLGMSFLNKLKEFQITGNKLTLVQR